MRHRRPDLDPTDPAMREARKRLATEVQEAKNIDQWERRLAKARAAVAPAEVVTFRFIPREGGFEVVAITKKDLEVPVSNRTTLGWPKV